MIVSSAKQVENDAKKIISSKKIPFTKTTEKLKKICEEYDLMEQNDSLDAAVPANQNIPQLTKCDENEILVWTHL